MSGADQRGDVREKHLLQWAGEVPLHRTGSAKRLAATMGAGSDVPDTMPAAAFMAVSFSPGTIARETSAVATGLHSRPWRSSSPLRYDLVWRLAQPPWRKSCETMSGSRWSGALR